MTNQKGISTLGLLVGIIIFAFVLTVGFKIGPLYLDNMFVRESIESLQNEKYSDMTDRDIVRFVQNSFDINNIRDLSTKDMTIERQKHKLLVTLDYEKRVHLMGNVDVVVMFKNHFDSSAL